MGKYLKDKFADLFRCDHPDTAYLTGLRAYAALGVFLIHSGGQWLRDFGQPFNQVVEDGKWGVVIFFVLSGYVISLSILNAKKFNYKTYFIRRCLRILPLYFLLVLLLWIIGYNNYWTGALGVDNDLYSVLAHFSFYNLIDQRYAVSSMGVEWTIPIEFFHYLIIPFVLWGLTKWRRGLTVVIALALIYKTKILFPNMMPEDFSYLHGMFLPHTYLPLFVVATIMAYIYFLKIKWLLPLYSFISYMALLCVGGLLLWRYGFYDQLPAILQEGRIFFAILTGFIILAGWASNWIVKILFENRLAIFFGNISFSFYLIHFPVLDYMPADFGGNVKSIIALFIVTILSCLTFLFVEKPAMSLQRRRRQ